jgi:pilus assembly protein Flp/PilA
LPIQVLICDGRVSSLESETSAMNHIRQFLREDDGPAAVEYAVMLALILMAAFSSIQLFGSGAGGSFSNSHNEIVNAINPP